MYPPVVQHPERVVRPSGQLPGGPGRGTDREGDDRRRGAVAPDDLGGPGLGVDQVEIRAPDGRGVEHTEPEGSGRCRGDPPPVVDRRLVLTDEPVDDESGTLQTGDEPRERRVAEPELGEQDDVGAPGSPDE